MSDISQKTYLNSSGSSIYTCLVVLMPILNQYMFGPLTFVDFFSVIGFVILFLSGKKIRMNNRHFGVVTFLIFTCFVTYSNAIFLGSSPIAINLRIAKFLLMMVNLFFIVPLLFDFKLAFKIYTLFVISAVFVFFVQYILYFAFHQHVVFLIPGVSLNYESGMLASDLIEHNIDKVIKGQLFRPRSFFIEPAFYSMYCLPWLAIAVCKKKYQLLALVVTLSLVLSTSTMGILISVVLWICYFFLNLDFIRNKFRIGILFVIFSIAAISFFDMNDVVQSLLIKQNQLGNLEKTGSLTVRIVRGWECFKQLDFIHQFFGCGYGNLGAYFFEHGVKTIYDYSNVKLDYMSGFFSVLCSIGVVGFIFNCCAIFSTIKKISTRLIPLLSVTILLMSCAAIWNTDKYYLCLVLLFAFSKDEDCSFNADAKQFIEGK